MASRRLKDAVECVGGISAVAGTVYSLVFGVDILTSIGIGAASGIVGALGAGAITLALDEKDRQASAR